MNVAVASVHASAIEFCLFDDAGEAELARLRLPGRTGPVFHGHIPGVVARCALWVDAPWPVAARRRAPIQPGEASARPLCGGGRPPVPARLRCCSIRLTGLAPDPADSAPAMPKGIVPAPAAPVPAPPFFDWDRQVIYELHVRGFTIRHPAIPPDLRGTFAGLAHPAAIAHLRALGVTAVELMPCAAWIDERHLRPLGLTNYWGYNPVAFCAPDPRLAPGGGRKCARRWRHCRRRTSPCYWTWCSTTAARATGWDRRYRCAASTMPPTTVTRADDPGRDIDDAGCGNTLALDRPPVLRLAMAALRNWASRAGVDGFRLDLATTLGRRADGFDAAAPLLAAMAQDPVLAGRDYRRPWDVGPGGYRLGAFPTGWGEWNDRFRDSVRRFWRGDGGVLGELATRFAGSADIFAAPRPISRSINFITAHDGFTLADLVAYTTKRNAANGEVNRDGTDTNLSWNNGIEGDSDDPAVAAARRADARALLATLLLARGTPMLSMGDEAGRTQHGNNNAYAQDNPLSWFDWEALDDDLLAFTAGLVAARRDCPALRRPLSSPGRRWTTADCRTWPGTAPKGMRWTGRTQRAAPWWRCCTRRPAPQRRRTGCWWRCMAARCRRW